MIKKILLVVLSVIVLCVLGFLALVATKPNSYVVERSTTIQAPPARIFPLINDFHAWKLWSPFEKLDPDAKLVFTETAAGKGAVMSWDGNDQVGAGTMKILESKPDELVFMEQEFSRPQQGKCDVIFELTPSGGDTKVTWRFSGKYGNFAEKAICTAMNLDAMLGPKLEEGLAGIKRAAEVPQTQSSEEKTADAVETPPAADKAN